MAGGHVGLVLLSLSALISTGCAADAHGAKHHHDRRGLSESVDNGNGPQATSQTWWSGVWSLPPPPPAAPPPPPLSVCTTPGLNYTTWCRDGSLYATNAAKSWDTSKTLPTDSYLTTRTPDFRCQLGSAAYGTSITGALLWGCLEYLGRLTRLTIAQHAMLQGAAYRYAAVLSAASRPPLSCPCLPFVSA